MATAKENAQCKIEKVKQQTKVIIATAKGWALGHCFVWALVRTSPARVYKACLGSACLSGDEFERVQKEIGEIEGVKYVWINMD